jgi:hypothetical protein
MHPSGLDLQGREPPTKICSDEERRSAGLREMDELNPDRQQLNRAGRL